MDWYFRDGDSEIGPLSDSEFHELVSRGRVGPDTQVRNDAYPEWRPHRELVAAEKVKQAESLVQQGSSGAEALGEDPFAAEDVRASRRLPGMTGGELNYASFGARLAAKIIDWLILGAALFVLILLLMVVASADGGEPGIFSILALLIYVVASLAGPFTYNAWFVAKRGATPGKAAMGLAVTDANGKMCGWGQAWGRAFAELLSQLTAYIGYLLALFDAEHRTLHDLVCDTRVVRKL